MANRKCVWKDVGGISITLTIRVPTAAVKNPCSIACYFHGGCLVGGDAGDISKPLVAQFLGQNCVLLSVNYRLLPESDLADIEEDLQDLEKWIHKKLQRELTSLEVTVDTSKIIVIGASAGALLALWTPKLWDKPPKAILSMYGPPDLHNISCTHIGRFEQPPQEVTPDLLNQATFFNSPPTEIPPTSEENKPRKALALHLVFNDLLLDFWIIGLRRDKEGTLHFPKKGSATPKQIDECSPAQLCEKFKYPPVCQIIGEKDDVFPLAGNLSFAEKLKQQQVECRTIIVPGASHAFDSSPEIGGDIYQNYICTAVTSVVSRLHVE